MAPPGLNQGRIVAPALTPFWYVAIVPGVRVRLVHCIGAFSQQLLGTLTMSQPGRNGAFPVYAD